MSAPFGVLPDGRPVAAITLRNAAGMAVTMIEWGATIVRWLVPAAADASGTAPVNVVLGYDTLPPYLARPPYFGCTLGRYANRIAHGCFELDGRAVHLASNDGAHHLHGGIAGFDQRRWQADTSGEGVLFRLHSPDGDEGYPGAVDISARFTLADDGTLRIDYHATSSAPTVVNVSHHSYFNLAGGGDVLDHGLQLSASRYTPVDDGLIPTGAIATVIDTPLGFTGHPRRIGDRIAALAAFPGGGYDHNFVLDRAPGSPALVVAAELIDPASGRRLRCRTTEPGLQFYTGNFLPDGLPVAGPLTTRRHAALCWRPSTTLTARINRRFRPRCCALGACSAPRRSIGSHADLR